MKRNRLALIAFLILTISVHAQSAGGGISVFVPESLYRYANGTIAFEQGLSTSFGFGSLVSIPLGFVYHSTDGYLFEHSDLPEAQGPSFYGDSFIPYAGIKAQLPISSSLYFNAFGGGLLSWAFSMRPNALGLAQNIADTKDQNIAFDDIVVERSIGYGWMAGGALGVKFGQISIDLGVTYRHVMIPVTVSADVQRVDGALVTDDHVRYEGGLAVLRGLSIRLGGSYSLK